MESYHYKKLHRKVDWIIAYLIQERELLMATWQDVKDAVAYDREVDAKVMEKLAALKDKLDNLPIPESGPTAEEFQAVVDDLRGHADDVMATIADKPAPVEVPVEEPVEAPVEAPVEPTPVQDVPTDIAE